MEVLLIRGPGRRRTGPHCDGGNAMSRLRTRLSWDTVGLDSPSRIVILVCLLAMLSYLAARLGGALIVHPETAWPLWPGCALLVAALLLAPRRIWPVLIPGAFAGFVLYDLRAGV